jgi:hypothetical protein
MIPKIPNYLRILKGTKGNRSTILATKKIPNGTKICCTDILNLDYIDGSVSSPNGNVFLHSEKSNAILKINENPEKIDIFAKRDIQIGEEILVTYPNTRRQPVPINELIKLINDLK